MIQLLHVLYLNAFALCIVADPTCLHFYYLFVLILFSLTMRSLNLSTLVWTISTSWCLQLVLGQLLQEEALGNDDTILSLKQFSVALKVRTGQDVFKDSSILQNGVMNEKWGPKCGVNLLHPCRPITFDKYVDELTLGFSYTNISLYRFMKPTVNASQGRARPIVSEFAHDDEEGSGDITIWHNCGVSAERGNDVSRIALSFYIRANTAVHLSWRKVCGSGEHSRIDYGYKAERSSQNRGIVFLSLKGSAESHSELVTFGPRILSTRLYMRLLDEDYSQQFTRPRVGVYHALAGHEAAEGRKMSTEMRGASHGGMMRGTTETVFDVLYTCDGPGLWRVKLEVGVTPFEVIEMEWLKDCGGGTEHGVSVANDPHPIRADIVREGATLPAYAREAGGPPPKGGDKNAVWGRGGGNKIFFLIVDGRAWKAGEGGIAVGEVVAHSEDERIGTARIGHPDEVYGSMWTGYKPVLEDGEVVTRRVRRLLRIRVDCLKQGWTRIAVRIAVRDRHPIEWWFWNECVTKTGRRHDGFSAVMSTTGLTLWLTILVVLILLKRVCSSTHKQIILHSRYRGTANRFRTVYPNETHRMT